MSDYRLNRSGEMAVFAKVVEFGGFSQAARHCGLSQSAVSKLISRLETRLGARLFNRSTRHLNLTAEGAKFYDRVRLILSEIEDAEREVGSGEQPAGHLRVNTSASYAIHILEPILPLFLRQFPDITVDINLTDQIIDMFAERTDVVVRAGPLKDSNLIARKLGETAMRVCASPAYLERYGFPQTMDELMHHCRIGFGYLREIEGWHFVDETDKSEYDFDTKKSLNMVLQTRVQASDGETVRRLALNGLGLARLAEFTIRDDLSHGRLHPVLDHAFVEEKEVFHAIFMGQGGPLPARVRAFLDFLSQYGQVD